MNETDHGDRPGRPGETLDPLGRRQFLRGLAAAGALAGAGGLLAACCSSGSAAPAASSPAATAAKKRGGALKVGLTGGSGSDTLDPHKGLTYLDTARAQSLYQPLLQLNTKAQAEFVLAEEISPHGSTSDWVIRLRPGITFHDGKPLTADDVIFTLKRIITGKLTGANSLGPDRREEPEEARQAHRPGADDQPLRQLPRPAGLLVLPVHRARRLQPEPSRTAPARSSTRASPRASAASSSGTRTTGSRACRTWTR